MRLDQLTYLVDLKDSHSIAQTAKRYIISHQALSKSMKALEEELNVALFKRSHCGIEFTPAGLIVLDFAQKVLSEKQELNQSLAPFQIPNIPAPQKESLYLYFVPRYSTPHFFNFVKQYAKKNDQYDIILKNASAARILSDVPFSDNSLAFFTVDSSTEDKIYTSFKQKNLTYTLLSTAKLYACVHKSSKLATKKTFSYSDIIAYPSLTFNYPLQIIDNDLFHVPITYTLDDFNQQKNFLKEFSCYALYTEDEYQRLFDKSFSLIPLSDLSIQLSFICIHSSHPLSAIDDLINAYRRFFQGN